MLSPFLVLGLGGSGGKTLQTLRDNLLRQLRQAGWQKDDLPAAWQLVQIDVPPVQSELQADLPDPLRGDSYVGLVTRGVSYSTVDQALSQRLAGNEMARQAMAGWRPRSDAVTVPIEKGAGQYRAIGRFLTVYHIDRIKRAIEAASVRMSALSSSSELKHVAELLGQDSVGTVSDPTAVVVSSIAGGTGAGMFMDLCDVLRATRETWASQSVAILFTPDIFDELPAQARSGVRPNALASLSEILAGFWDQDGFGEDEAALLQLVGVAPLDGEDRIGPRYPFLMGRSNGAVTFKRQNDVYRSAGRALSSWIVSPEIQSAMSNYVFGNWAQAGAGPDTVPFKEQAQENPFQSMGFARVSLGRDRFLQYASECLARGSIERLLSGHLEGKAFDDPRSDEDLIQARVARATDDFIAASKLDITPNIAVLDILALETFKAMQRNLVTDLLEKVFPPGETELMGTAILGRGDQVLQDRRRMIDEKFRAHYRGALKEWASSTQEQFVSFLLEQSARFGIPVTRELAGKLTAHLQLVVIPSLNDAANEQMQTASTQVLDVPTAGTIGGDSTEAREVLNNVARKATQRHLGEALQLLATLMEDFRRNVAGPAVEALHQAVAELKHQQGQADAWPTFQTTEVPTRLGPTPNERILLPTEEFADRLHELLKQQSKAQDRISARNYGIGSVIAFPVDARTQRVRLLMSQGGRWTPEDATLRSSDSQPRALSITFDFKPRRLLREAEAFVDERNTVLGRYVRETIDQYLSQDLPAEERVKRVRLFEREFAEAMNAAAPMASVNPNVLMRVHERQLRLTHIFSGIPFAAQTDAYKAAERVLTAQGLDETDRSQAFRDSVRSQHVDIFTVLSSPLEAAVFDSLAKPIKEQWDKAAAGGEDQLAEFWRFRRTRPLPQSIPMAPNVRKAMVRGWFTARLLNQIIDEVDGSGRGRLAIFTPADGQMEGSWRDFPLPLLLPEDAGREDRVAGILKSAVIALLEVNNGNMDALTAYARLRALGTARGGVLSSYPTLNLELEEWVRRGKRPSGSPAPRPDWAGTASSDIQERQQTLQDRLVTWKRTYQERIFDPVSKLPDLSMAPRAWELRHDYIGALDDLWAAIHRVSDIGDDDL